MDLVSSCGGSFARQRLGKGLSVDAVSTSQYFILHMQKRANLTDSPFSKWESGSVLLSHGGEDGGSCEAKLCPSERHAMDGVAGAQHQGWVVLQISCKALELNATRWIWFLHVGVALRDSA